MRRLLDAALELMHDVRHRRRAPRVADIVAAAGLSNDAFYRHFSSKDALVTAILEDGAERLRSYLAHQMAKERTPDGKVRRWVAGVLGQADGEVAATTLAVLWNGGSADGGLAAGRHFASAPLASLLDEPFAALGSRRPSSMPRWPRTPRSACSRTACGAAPSRRAPRSTASRVSACAPSLRPHAVVHGEEAVGVVAPCRPPSSASPSRTARAPNVALASP